MAFSPLPQGTEITVLAAITLIVIWLIWGTLSFPEALWAPGDLSRHHADIKTCNDCHQPFQGVMARKCVDCHTKNEFSALEKPAVSAVHRTVIQAGEPCVQCHTEHRGALGQIKIGALENPHGEFVFNATATRSCSACHEFDLTVSSEAKPKLRDNLMVKYLLAKGEGRHQPGKMKACLKCHIGGRLDAD